MHFLFMNKRNRDFFKWTYLSFHEYITLFRYSTYKSIRVKSLKGSIVYETLHIYDVIVSDISCFMGHIIATACKT